MIELAPGHLLHAIAQGVRRVSSGVRRRSVEVAVLGAPLFSNKEPLEKKGRWGAARYSVSQLTIALSDFTALIWVLLILKVAPLPAFAACAWHDWFPVGLALIYGISLLIFGRSSWTD